MILINNKLVDLKWVYEVTEPIATFDLENQLPSKWIGQSVIASFQINMINDKNVEVKVYLYKAGDVLIGRNEHDKYLSESEKIKRAWSDFKDYHKSIVELIAKLNLQDIPNFSFNKYDPLTKTFKS